MEHCCAMWRFFGNRGGQTAEAGNQIAGRRGTNKPAQQKFPGTQLFVGIPGNPLAVAEGFEPRYGVTVHSISSAAPSAARTRYLACQ